MSAPSTASESLQNQICIPRAIAKSVKSDNWGEHFDRRDLCLPLEPFGLERSGNHRCELHRGVQPTIKKNGADPVRPLIVLSRIRSEAIGEDDQIDRSRRSGFNEGPPLLQDLDQG